MPPIGTWRIHTVESTGGPPLPMHTPTGDVTLDVAGLAYLNHPGGTGTAQANFQPDLLLYLNGSVTPTAVRDIPAGWTPNSPCSVNVLVMGSLITPSTVVASVDVVCAPLGLDVTLTTDDIRFNAGVNPYAVTGLTTRALLLACADATATATFTMTNSQPTDFIRAALVGTGGAFLTVTGTYHIQPGKLPPLPERTPITQGGRRG